MLRSAHGMRWYVNQSGKTIGPVSEERVAMLVTWGKVARDAYVCDEQLSTWVPISRTPFGALFDDLSEEPSEEPSEDVAWPSPGALELSRTKELTSEAPAPGQRLRALIAGIALLAGALALALAAS